MGGGIPDERKTLARRVLWRDNDAMNTYTTEEKLELAEVVLGYRDKMLAECCEPEEPTELWMDLADWFDEHPGRPDGAAEVG